MIDYKLLRDKLVEKILRKSKPLNITEKISDSCMHDFKRYKQSIRIDNDDFKLTAYFIVIACNKCKLKNIIDYKI